MNTNLSSERISLLEVECVREARGNLFPVSFSQLPFQPRRIFVIADVPVGTERGGHAHRDQTQLLVCLNGAVEVKARIGDETLTVQLDHPTRALLVSPRVWTRQKFLETDSRLLVLSSGEYDRNGYISD